MKSIPLLFVAALVLLFATACHADTAPTTTPPPNAPPPAADPATAAVFAKNNPSVTTVAVVVTAPANDPLDAVITSLGGFPATADVSHVHRPVKRSFAVAYDKSGNPVEAIYINDEGVVEVSTDSDILGMYAHKAHALVASAPGGGGSSEGDHSGSASHGGGDSSVTINHKTISVGMSKAEVRKKLGPPSAVFDEGTSHETWLIKPLDVGHDLGQAVVTQVASGFGLFGAPAQSAGDKLNSRQHEWNIRFNGDTVSRISVSSTQ